MILLIILLGLILRLILINQSLWLDEAAQVIESARPLSSQFDISGDFQPPLFHLFLHFWMKFGTSEAWMRLLTVSLSVISIYLLYKIGIRLVNRKFALLVSFLFSINPFAIYYAQELRPYPLTVFVSLIIVWGWIINSSLLLIIGMTLFLYTTYFALFFIISLLFYVYFWQKSKFKWIVKNTFIAVLFFIPWLPSFLEQLKNGLSLTKTMPGWGSAVSIPFSKAIFLIFAKFFLGRITIDNKVVYAVVVTLLIGVFLYLLKKSTTVKHLSFFACLFFIPLTISLVISLIIPVVEPKRLLFILPFFLAIISLGLLKTKKICRKGVLILILTVFFFGNFSYYLNPRFQRENWREAVYFVEKNGDGTQIALFIFPQPFAPYLWYQKKNIGYGIAKNFVVSDDDIKNLKILVKNRQKIFLFQYLSEITDPTKKIPKILEEEGFTNTNTYDFPGVGFIFQYDKASLALAS